jgi:hypothetical protein
VPLAAGTLSVSASIGIAMTRQPDLSFDNGGP